MSRLFSRIAIWGLYGLSLLPLSLLYGLSFLAYFLVYRIVGYRKRVVFTNLQNAFPEKTQGEIEHIAKGFYRFFCDTAIETIRAISMSSREMKQRLAFTNPEVLNRLHEAGRHVVIAMGHVGNWELLGQLAPAAVSNKIAGIYHPAKNELFDLHTVWRRERFGLACVPMKEVGRYYATHKNDPFGMLFIADQSPAPESAYWTDFLNQDTPMYRGMEKIARKYNAAVVYLDFSVIRRGRYQITCKTITEAPNELPPDGIVEAYTRLLEDNIRRHPTHWLWSHRRWKHKRALE